MPDDCAVAWEMDAVHVDQTRPRGETGQRGSRTNNLTKLWKIFSV